MTQVSDDMTLRVDQEVEIAADAEKAFASLLANLTDGFGQAVGRDMAMKLEQWPGGRWFRDLGSGQGHFWGHVQVIKPPTLLEITGPMFMSYPAISHLQIRLMPNGDRTLLKFTHRALGLIDPEHRKGASQGWGGFVKAVKQQAERK
jgi:hypothetical protein